MEIKGYTIVREISRGPVTTVYLARQEALEREVFLKVLNVHLKDEPDLLERFRREAKICARLRHPNVVSVFDFGAAGESFYISMEYLEGKSLSEIIREHQPLPFDVILFITQEVARGLVYAHNFGVVHRDIKPANIMIEKNGVVKIADFGLATKTDLPTVTIQHSAVGTPAYMSPEQASGKELDKRTDLFSLGATIYEMCSGRSPFLGETLAESVNKVFTYEPPSLHKIRADIPLWFSQMAEHLLEKDPGKRLSAAERIIQLAASNQTIIKQNDFKAFLEAPKSFSKPGDKITDSNKEPQNHGRKKWIFAVLPIGLVVLFFTIWYTNFMSGEPAGDNKTSALSGADTALVRDTTFSNEPLAVEDNFSRTPAREETVTEASAKMRRPAVKNTEKVIPPAGGRLMIICNPWAKIYVDDEYVETTPLNRALVLATGEHILELKNPNYKSLRQKIMVEQNRSDTLRINLKPNSGFIMVQALPWAKVYLDDVFKGTTPLEAPVSVAAGKHILKLVNPNYQTIYDTLTVVSGELIEKRVRLKK